MKKVLEDLVNHDMELSVLFTDDRHIAQLNRHYRMKDKPANVLAFPISNGASDPDVESKMLGDVVISVDTAINESKEFKEPLEETIYRLLIHGTLHLLNYDHERSPDEAKRMEKEQKRLLAMMKE